MSSRKLVNRVKPRVIAWIVIIAGVACLGLLGFLREKNRVHTLGRDIRRLEGELETARKKSDLLRRSYAAMCSHAELDARARQMNLGLTQPQPEQFVRMFEPGSNPTVEKRLAEAGAIPSR